MGIKEYYNEKIAEVLEQALMFKFPDIKNLNVSPSDTGCRITYNDDGIHSKEMIELFCDQLKESAGFSIAKNVKSPK